MRTIKVRLAFIYTTFEYSFRHNFFINNSSHGLYGFQSVRLTVTRIYNHSAYHLDLHPLSLCYHIFEAFYTILK